MMTLADRLRRLGFEDTHAWESRVSQGTLAVLVGEMERVWLPQPFSKITSTSREYASPEQFISLEESSAFKYPTPEEQINYWAPVIDPQLPWRLR
jgi:hypothetical protein